MANAERTMTVALLGDTHGALDERVRAVATGCDRIVHTGDVGGYSILESLMLDGIEPVAVRGNNDTRRHWGNDGPDHIDALPALASLHLPTRELTIVHGHRIRARDRHSQLRAAYPDARAIVYGHSHRLIVDREAWPSVLNPGAAGRSRAYGGPACLVLHAGCDRWSIQAYRFEPLRTRR